MDGVTRKRLYDPNGFRVVGWHYFVYNDLIIAVSYLTEFHRSPVLTLLHHLLQASEFCLSSSLSLEAGLHSDRLTVLLSLKRFSSSIPFSFSVPRKGVPLFWPSTYLHLQ